MRFLKGLSETGAGPVAVLAAFTFAVFAFLMCAVLPVRAQGSGVGTLPGRSAGMSVVRRSGLLDEYSTLAIQSDWGARFLIVSTQTGQDMASGDPQNPAVKTFTWRHNHTTCTLTVPEWQSEIEDGADGERRFEARAARMLTDEQLHFPPDAT